jgi:hypothetical protein
MNSQRDDEQDRNQRTPPIIGPKRLVAWPLVGSTLTAVAVAVGSTILSVQRVFYRPLLGATRSSRLQWQARSAEIDEAVANQQTQLTTNDDDVCDQ